ncbi:MAG: spore coat protein [Ruthenibacterium sp.]
MKWSQKESSLLQDLKADEKLCVEKYEKYASDACDAALQNVFAKIEKTEQGHLNTVNTLISGTVPPLPKAKKAQTNQSAPAPATKKRGAQSADKKHDAYLCTDALSTEKHVSAVYDTSVFEFKDPQVREILNHIQKEEQQHGEAIYAYMASHGMY